MSYITDFTVCQLTPPQTACNLPLHSLIMATQEAGIAGNSLPATDCRAITLEGQCGNHSLHLTYWLLGNVAVISKVLHSNSLYRTEYSAVPSILIITWTNFSKNIHKRHLIACPLGQSMGCLLWIESLIDILPQFLQWCVQYHFILNRVMISLDCSSLGTRCANWPQNAKESC